LRPFLQTDINAYLFSPAASESERRAKAHVANGTYLSCGNKPGSNRARQPRKSLGEYYTKDSYKRAIAAACDRAFPPPPRLARTRVNGNGRKEKSTRWETVEEWQTRLGAGKWAELIAWQKAHRFHPHQLRHAAGTLIRQRFGIEAVQTVLGQKSPVMAELYAEKDTALAARVIAEIG
jgi:integrase